MLRLERARAERAGPMCANRVLTFLGHPVRDVEAILLCNNVYMLLHRRRLLLLVEFSACGGIRTGNIHVLAYGIFGKGELFVAPPLEDRFTGLTRSSTQA